VVPPHVSLSGIEPVSIVQDLSRIISEMTTQIQVFQKSNKSEDLQSE